MQENKNMRELAEKTFRMMVEPFISHPEHLGVKIHDDQRMAGGLVLEPSAHFADMGKIVGIRGDTFKSLETILKLIGWRNRIWLSLKRMPPATIGTAEFQPPFDPDLNWDNQETYGLFKDVASLILSQKEFKILEDEESTWFIFKTDEKLPIAAAEVARALSKIFHAIGKSRGRLIYVTDNIEEAKAKLNEASAKSN